MKPREMALVAMCAVLIFAQEQALVFLPNIQLTTLLILVFSRFFKLRSAFIMVWIYVFLDHLLMGGFSILYTPSALLAWSMIPLASHTFLVTSRPLPLALSGFIFGFLYGWMYLPAWMIQYGMRDAWLYLVADFPFEVIMAITNFLTILWLYEPLTQRIQIFMERRNVSFR